jgi:hypothetical protein
MELSQLHLLLTYQCTYECDHCFVWGSPWQNGTMRLESIREILEQARDLGTVEWIYFEGGEPFLHYPVLARGVEAAAEKGFRVGIVTNGYWATSVENALEWLRPFAGLVQDLSVSSDLFHGSERLSQQAKDASIAAERLGIPPTMITIARPEREDVPGATGRLPAGESAVMFRGRAADALVGDTTHHSWETFVECPHEDLREPERVHVDPFGRVHACQGISLGCMFHTPLRSICEEYDPDSHPILGALLVGGPSELVRRFDLPHAEKYADPCHLCYEARVLLRDRFPEALAPDQMYGVFEG